MKIITVEPYYWSCSHWGLFECTFWDMFVSSDDVVRFAEHTVNNGEEAAA